MSTFFLVNQPTHSAAAYIGMQTFWTNKKNVLGTQLNELFELSLKKKSEMRSLTNVLRYYSKHIINL